MRTLIRSALILGALCSAPVIAMANPETKKDAKDTATDAKKKTKDVNATPKEKAKNAADAKKDKADHAADADKDKAKGW